MRKLLIALTVVMALCLTMNLALAADPGDDTATADIEVTVNSILEWSAESYTKITLDAMTSEDATPEGSTVFTLYTNCNCEISADNTTAAELALTADPNQTLVTSYKLTDDGDGSATTGGTDESGFTGYATFIPSASAYAITHVAGDGKDVITLYAKADFPGGEVMVADAGLYEATQTLTASWTSDD